MIAMFNGKAAGCVASRKFGIKTESQKKSFGQMTA